MRLFICLLSFFCWIWAPLGAAVHTNTHYYLLSPTKNLVVALDRLSNEKTLIPVGKKPVSMEIYRDKGYVVNRNSHTLSIIDIKTHTVIDSIYAGQFPNALTIYKENGYVVNRYANKVTVINLITNTTIKTIDVLKGPVSMSVYGHEGYVVNSESKSISVIDLWNNCRAADIDVGGRPAFMTIYKGKGIVGVAGIQHFVVVIDLENRKILIKLSLDAYPNPIQIYKNQGYIINTCENTLTVLDLDKNVVKESIHVGKHPIAILQDGGVAYVLNKDSRDISVIDLKKGEVVATVSHFKSLRLESTNSHLYLGTKQVCPLFPKTSSIEDYIKKHCVELVDMLPDGFDLGEVEARPFPDLPTFVDLLPLKEALDSLKTWESDPYAYIVFISMLQRPERIIHSKRWNRTVLPALYQSLLGKIYSNDQDSVMEIMRLAAQLDLPLVELLATYKMVISVSAMDGMQDAIYM